MKVVVSLGLWRHYIYYKKRENIKAVNFIGQNPLVLLAKVGWMDGGTLGS